MCAQELCVCDWSGQKRGPDWKLLAIPDLRDKSGPYLIRGLRSVDCRSLVVSIQVDIVDVLRTVHSSQHIKMRLTREKKQRKRCV